jgi:hypothetical protein
MVQAPPPASNCRPSCFMQRMIRTAFVALALLGASAATAAAAQPPPWSSPQTLSSPSLLVDDPDVVVSADGRALATWRWSGPKPAAGTRPTGTRLAVREPGAPLFGPERSAPSFVTPLITYSLDRVVGLDTLKRGSGRVSLRARFGDSRGEFGPPRTISTYSDPGFPPSLAGPNGSLVAWIAKSAHGRRIVRAALKSGGRFRHPFTLRSRGRANDVVAGQALGVMFVAWERAGRVEARVKLSAQRRWGPLQRLGRGSAFATSFKAVGAGRRAYLAWLAESAESASFQVAVLPAASARFRAPQLLEKIAGSAPAETHPFALVATQDRDALIAWTGWDGAHWRVRVAATGGGPRFGDLFGISPAAQNSVLGDAAAAPPGTPLTAGTTMFVWSRLDAVGELGDRVQAAIRPPGGPLGPIQDLSDLDRARLPAVAFDFKSVRWTAVWSQRIGPDAPGVPLAQVTTFARAATRPG